MQFFFETRKLFAQLKIITFTNQFNVVKILFFDQIIIFIVYFLAEVILIENFLHEIKLL